MRGGDISVYEFGKQLLQTNDLDPVYVLVYETRMEEAQLKHWLIAYWCFYHVGTACWIAQSRHEYWERMETAAGSKEWPRSSERRHFRGENAAKSVRYLRERGVSSLFGDIELSGDSSEELIETVQQWVGFGPWIAFKVADMIERIGMKSVQFSLDTVLYDSPRKAAEILWERENGGKETHETGPWAIDRILKVLEGSKAPPRYERPINAQEAETVLCKWKSYLNGHYHIGEDISACRSGLMKFSRVKLAQRLLKAGISGGLWS